MKRQGGQALILVLILLAVGTLLIVPVLRFTFTGLRSQSISEDVVTKQYATDSAVEDALWQLLRNGVLDILNSENTSYTYDFQLDSANFTVSIQVPTVPESDWIPYLPDPERELFAKVEVVPNWLEANADNTTFTYIIRIDSSQWDNITDFGFTLPLGLTYADNSTLYMGPEKHTELDPDAAVNYPMIDPLNENNWVNMTAGRYEEVYDELPADYDPNKAYLLITTEQGRQTLKWMPAFVEEGRKAFIQAFKATGNPDWGVYYVEPSFAFENFTFELGETAALAIAMYNILIDYGGATHQVVVAYDSATDGMKMVSYQIVE